MARPTLESIEKAQQRVDQAKARLQALQARASALDRKADARRKIILGGLLLDAAMKDAEWEKRLGVLMDRISRDQDRKAFDGWTFRGGPADG
ncbi:conjugal transfer protein TraD [Sphingomonas sp.]|jgi:hypothetical protein|uniref:conjugal transfer protein TraD n=1 Tax=Sphingomonas sp. TaxID=28214 RepID=UPI0028A1A769|nr:conjugal transfer protein TraD [Sphingomonas sp.]